MRLNSKCILLIGVLAFFLSACSATDSEKNLNDEVDAYFEPLVKDREFSGVVMVARGNELLIERAYGIADFESGRMHSPDESFAIASLSKTFTAAAIEILAERGTLGFGDLISEHIQNFPHGDKITVEMLLLHQSGVVEVERIPNLKDMSSQEVGLSDIVAFIGSQPLRFEPGTDSAYSNAGYLILAHLIEQVSGQPFQTFLASEIFTPLDLTETNINWSVGETVPGYFPGKPPGMVERRSRDRHPSHGLGASELRSTGHDLIKWLRAVDEGRLTDKFALDYPYGWGVRDYFGQRVIEQSGITDGFVSAMALFPDKGLYVVVLSNIRAGLPQRRAHIDMAGLFLGEPLTLLETPTLDFDTGQDHTVYSGRYDFPSIGVIEIEPEGELLKFTWVDFDLSSYLYPTSSGAYWNRLDGMEVAFEKEGDSEVSALIWSPGENEIRASRMDATSKD